MDEDVLDAIGRDFHSPQRIGEGGQSVVYIAQRALVPDARQRWQYVVIKAPVGRPEKPSFYDKELKILESLVGVPGVPSHPEIVLTENFPLFITSMRSRDIHSPVPVPLENCQMITTGVRSTVDLINWAILAASIAQTLCAIHALGVVHHDVKPGNIVLNRTRGRWLGICMIDFGSALMSRDAETAAMLGTWEYLSPGRIRELCTHLVLRRLAHHTRVDALQRSPESFANDDRNATGVTLIELAAGQLCLETEVYSKAIRSGLHAEDLDLDVVCRATGLPRTQAMKQINQWIAQACTDRGFRDRWERISRAYRNGTAVREWIAGLPSTDESVVHKLVRICDRYLLSDTGEAASSEFAGATDALLQFRTEIEYLIASPARRTAELGVRVSPVKAQIASLVSLAKSEETREWCELYAAHPVQLPNNIDECLRQLRNGHGTSARLGLTAILLDDGLQNVPTPAIVSATRALVGFLLPRERLFATAHEVLDRLEKLPVDSNGELQAWSAILRDYLRVVAGQQLELEKPQRPTFSNDRLAAWAMYTKWLAVGLSRPQDLSVDELNSAVSNFLAGSKSTTEMVSAMLLHAKLLSAATDVFAEPMILARLVGAAAIARTKKLPFEYARTLRLAATIIFERLARSSGRDLLPDHERLRELASGCAEHAAEMFFFLGRMDEAIECSLIASIGLCQSDDSELCVQALRTMSYAENLSRMTDVLPTEVRRQQAQLTSRFSSGKNPTSSEQILVQWRSVLHSAVKIYGTDPGSHFARGFYNKYGNPISDLWQTGGGLAVELCGENGIPEQGAALRHLWQMASKPALQNAGNGRRVLDMGCGIGTDAVYLASLGYEVVAVDASPWCIEQAKNRHGGRESIVFVHADVTAVDVQAFGKQHGLFDVILMRDSLCHISNKAAVLQVSWALLRDHGLLMFSDWIQKSPASLSEYLDMLCLLEFTGLETWNGYRSIVEESGFALLEMSDMTGQMERFWRSRLHALEAFARASKSTSSQRSAFTKFHRVLQGLEACTYGKRLGWAFCVAQKKSGRSYVTGYKERIQRIVPKYAQMVTAVRDIVARVPGARVLELGVGDGTMTAALSEAGARRVTCVDQNPDVLDHLRTVLSVQYVGVIDVVAGNVFEADTWNRVCNDFYDIVVASLIFHDASPSERVAFILNIAAKLRRNGYFVFVDPLRFTASFTARLDDWRGAGMLSEAEIQELEEHDPVMFDPIRVADLHAMCREAGLEFVVQPWAQYHFALQVFRKV